MEHENYIVSLEKITHGSDLEALIMLHTWNHNKWFRIISFEKCNLREEIQREALRVNSFIIIKMVNLLK